MNQIQIAEQKISKYLNNDKMQKYLHDVLGDSKDKFVTNLISVTNQNKDLQRCTNMSLVSGALVATTLNLSLNIGFGYAYLVPYDNKKYNSQTGRRETISTEAQFQIGYRGYIQLALRTGQYKRINAVPVYESQFRSWNALTEEIELNNVDNFENDKVVGYVSYFKLNNGFEKTMFWSYDKILNHADEYSSAFSKDKYFNFINGKVPKNELWKYSSEWYKNFDNMALKTMLRQSLSKYGIMSEEMLTAYENDQSVINNGNIDYIDSPQFIQHQPQQKSLNDVQQQKVNEFDTLKDTLLSKYSKDEDSIIDFLTKNRDSFSKYLSDNAVLENEYAMSIF